MLRFIKAFLIACFSIALGSSLEAAIPIAAWSLDNTLAQTSGTTIYGPLTMIGSVPFVSSPAPTTGTFWAGTFFTSRYFTTPAGFNTAFTNLPAYTIHYRNCLLNSLASNEVVWSTTNGVTYIQIFVGGVVQVVMNGGSALASGTLAFSLNTNHTLTLSWDGTNRRLYVDNTQVASDTNSGALTSIPNMYFGLYQGTSNAMDGYISSAEFYTTALTPPIPLPPTFSTGTNAKSPLLRNYPSPYIGVHR